MRQGLVQQKEVFELKDKKCEFEIQKNEALIKTQQERINKLVEVQEEMKDQLNADQVELALDGNRLSVLAVASCFSDLNRVKRQQKVYAFLNAFIADGTLHAVSIKALSPEELS